MTSHVCPICSVPAEASQLATSLERLWDCPRCGKYEIGLLTQTNNATDSQFAYKISAAIRAQNQSGITPQITKRFLETAVREPDKTLSDKSRLVLEYLEKRTSEFGESVKVMLALDYPLVHAKSEAEFMSLLGMHRDVGYISDFHVPRNSVTQIILKAQGFEALEAMRRTRPDADSAFVAMWFDEQMTPIYLQQIAPAIQDAGYRPIKIDLVPHNDDVIARIMTEIRLAKFVVADFTGHRNGVYFEAGFAKGVGMEVVWLCREDHMKDAHFDTNHFNHLTWKDDGSLREHLAARILATVGPGPHYRKSSTAN